MPSKGRVFMVGCLLVGSGLSMTACRQEAGPVTEVEPGEIFGQMCASCHGQDGRGNKALMATLPIKDLTSAEVQQQQTETLEQVIMAGRNQMPAFGGSLTPRKIQALVGHIRDLGKSK